MALPIRAFALVVVGSTGLPAWGQVGLPSAGSGARNAAPAAAISVAPTAVAAFPDVPERSRALHARARETRGPARLLLDPNPYGGELAEGAADGAALLALDDENPYPERVRLGDPCSAEPRIVARPERGRAPAKADLPLELDVANPYARTGR